MIPNRPLPKTYEILPPSVFLWAGPLIRLMCFDKDQYDCYCGYISSANIDIFRPTRGDFCQNWSKQGVPLTVNSCRPKWQWRWDDDGLGVQASVLRWHCQGCQPLPGRPSPASAGFHPTTQPTHLPTSSTRALGSLAGSCLIRVLASKWQIFLLPSISVQLKQSK